ncbi:uncharacterized protein LOC127283175 [Leptopilina boulardi]|uniref:uncharacterized protein LOC127283175 n=1 Tax=Leptopilina boulardi TaxID=63433 RepID=UPI0021F553EE|nr:uncharacterized protein LOC127283175 [Leptopilina boulardi]
MDATDLNDPLQTCPYDESHRVMKSRMQWHLVKCRKNHISDKSQFKTCPYDVTHIINEVEFAYHINNCSKSGSVVNFIQSMEPTRCVGAVPMSDIINVYVPPVQENWDNDPPEKTYDALAAAKSKGVSIPEVGLSKAKKKSFIKSERLRIKNLEDNGVIFNPTPKTSKNQNFEDEQTDALDDIETPLRPPRSKAAAASICSNTDYIDESLNNTRQLNSTIHSEISAISTSTAIPRQSINSQFSFESVLADVAKKNEGKFSQSSNYSINLFNPAPNEVDVNGIDMGNLHISTEYSSSSTLHNIDSNICPLDVNSSTSSNMNLSNISEIQTRLAIVKNLEENLQNEKEKLRKMVVNFCPSDNNDENFANNSRCAANFSNAKEK